MIQFRYSENHRVKGGVLPETRQNGMTCVRIETDRLHPLTAPLSGKSNCDFTWESFSMKGSRNRNACSLRAWCNLGNFSLNVSMETVMLTDQQSAADMQLQLDPHSILSSCIIPENIMEGHTYYPYYHSVVSIIIWTS